MDSRAEGELLPAKAPSSDLLSSRANTRDLSGFLSSVRNDSSPVTFAPWRLCGRYSDLFSVPFAFFAAKSPNPILFMIAPQLRGRMRVELETPSVLPDRHAVVAPCRFDGNVTRTHIGEHFLRRSRSKRMPKSAATAGFDREAVAVVDLGRLDFSGRKGLCTAPSLRMMKIRFASASLPPCNPQGAQIVRST